MDEQELCKKRLIDLSKQADRKGIVTFSTFLNLNEQNIYHTIQKELYTQVKLSGGYDGAERQMIAFIPDALCYEWEFPIICIEARPQYPKFAEKLTHRDVLGALMHLGIDRGKIGDIICQSDVYYIFCDEMIHSFIMENLRQIRHTTMKLSVVVPGTDISIEPTFREQNDMIAL